MPITDREGLRAFRRAGLRQGPFEVNFPLFFSLFFGLVFGRFFSRFWLHFGGLSRPFCLPKKVQKTYSNFCKVLRSILLHFSMIFLQFCIFLAYSFGTFVKKAEPTNSPPMPMKSEVRALKNDAKIDPKSDQKLDKNRVFFFMFFLMLLDRCGLRFRLHFGTRNAPRNGSKKQTYFETFLDGFWRLLGLYLATILVSKINGKTSLLQGSPKGCTKDAKRLKNDTKWTPKGLENRAKLETKSEGRKGGREEGRKGEGRKGEKEGSLILFICLCFLIALSSDLASSLASKTLQDTVQLSLWGPAVTPALRAQ